MTPVTRLRNLGPVSAEMLREIDVKSAEELRDMGAVEAYRRLRFVFGARANQNLFFALLGALEGRDWRDFSRGEENARLKQL